MVTEGKKIAKISAARFIQSEKGNMGLEVAFRCDEGTITWIGWLTEKAIERTMSTLIDCLGFNGDDEVIPNSSQLKPTALDMNRDVELIVENEEYEGKVRPRVKWVNQPGGGSAFKTLSPEVVRGSLNMIGFKAHYLAAKKQKPQEEVPF